MKVVPVVVACLLCVVGVGSAAEKEGADTSSSANQSPSRDQPSSADLSSSGEASPSRDKSPSGGPSSAAEQSPSSSDPSSAAEPSSSSGQSSTADQSSSSNPTSAGEQSPSSDQSSTAEHSSSSSSPSSAADQSSSSSDPPPSEDDDPPLLTDLSPSEEHESLNEEDGRGERIFAFYSSTTTTRLTTSTLTALSTCLSILDTAQACRRRKRRAGRMESIKDEDITSLDFNLESSVRGVESLEELSQQQRDFLRRDDRKFTIWTTGFTTLTLTTTSYIAGTTVTATAYCLTPGLTAGCFGK